MPEVEKRVSAPGRLCLLGEHQDYFGLPIIAAAINLRITIDGKKRQDRRFNLNLPDVGEKDAFPLDTELAYNQERDYLKSAVNILQREGLTFSSGWECLIKGNIPINAGTASSSALVVAWIKFLLEAAQDKRATNPESNAELAFQAEVAEFEEPGGKMDHYTSASGGVVSLHFGEKLRLKRHPNQLEEFVLADSLIKKNTIDTLGYIKKHVLSGLDRIQGRMKHFTLSSALGAREREEIEKLPEVEKRLLKGTLMTRDITAEGERLFSSDDFDHQHFGRLLSRQQDVMRDYLKVSLPKLDQMIETAQEAGALGAKINGSGKGGCIFAYTPGKSDQVAEALSQIGARPYVVRIDTGARVED